jgi:hypothetical protein
MYAAVASAVLMAIAAATESGRRCCPRPTARSRRPVADAVRSAAVGESLIGDVVVDAPAARSVVSGAPAAGPVESSRWWSRSPGELTKSAGSSPASIERFVSLDEWLA